MISMKKPAKGLLAAATALSLTGCGTTVMQVKDVNANKADHLAQHFQPANLPKAVVAQLPRTSTKLPFSTLVIKLDATAEENDGKKDVWKESMAMERLNDDLIQVTLEQSSNDIPFNVSFGISYRGIQHLRWQKVPLRAQFTSHIFEVKELKRIDALPTAVGQTFAAECATGTAIQVMNFSNYQLNCKATKQVPASEYHKILPGQVTELECQTSRDNVMLSRSKWVVMQQYGVALMVETASATSKTVYRITDVTAQP